jgi:hypothetical protein
LIFFLYIIHDHDHPHDFGVLLDGEMGICTSENHVQLQSVVDVTTTQFEFAKATLLGIHIKYLIDSLSERAIWKQKPLNQVEYVKGNRAVCIEAFFSEGPRSLLSHQTDDLSAQVIAFGLRVTETQSRSHGKDQCFRWRASCI